MTANPDLWTENGYLLCGMHPCSCSYAYADLAFGGWFNVFGCPISLTRLILNGMPSLPITLSKEDSFSADSPLADDDTSPQTASSVCCSLIINLDLNQARMVVCPFIPLMPFYGLFPRLTRESSLLSLFSAWPVASEKSSLIHYSRKTWATTS